MNRAATRLLAVAGLACLLSGSCGEGPSAQVDERSALLEFGDTSIRIDSLEPNMAACWEFVAVNASEHLLNLSVPFKSCGCIDAEWDSPEVEPGQSVRFSFKTVPTLLAENHGSATVLATTGAGESQETHLVMLGTVRRPPGISVAPTNVRIKAGQAPVLLEVDCRLDLGGERIDLGSLRRGLRVGPESARISVVVGVRQADDGAWSFRVILRLDGAAVPDEVVVGFDACASPPAVISIEKG